MKFIKKILVLLVICCFLLLSVGILQQIHQEPLVPSEVEQAVGIPYVVDNIPESNKRPGKKRFIRYIVIHNTANPESSAQNERDYLVNPTNTSSTSFNLVVDENEIVEAIPVNEVAFHAGTSEGNTYGIGIEICESGDYTKSEANAIKLVAYLRKKYNIPLDRVITHQDCSGKECPRLILDHWGHFKENVDKAYEEMK